MWRLKDPREQCDISPHYADGNFTAVSRALRFIIVLITRQKEKKITCRLNLLMLRPFKSEGWSQTVANCAPAFETLFPQNDWFPISFSWTRFEFAAAEGKCDCVLKTVLDSLVECIWNQSFSSQSNEIVRFALQFNVFREVNGKPQNKFSADASVWWQS